MGDVRTPRAWAIAVPPATIETFLAKLPRGSQRVIVANRVGVFEIFTSDFRRIRHLRTARVITSQDLIVEFEQLGQFAFPRVFSLEGLLAVPAQAKRSEERRVG